ncbi:MAG: TonB-dependent siderophore receptor [Thalassobaculaceae bacterium]|nr:TonB-dependent siderophore receptor [Thalassobaculaceae bacterium]
MVRSTPEHRAVFVSFLLAGVAYAALSTSAVAQQAGGSTIVLDPITVEGDPGVVTEDTGSYTTDRATVGYKQPVDVRDVPQSVTVVTRQRLDDANANSLEEAGYLIPNVTTATGNMYDGSLYSRGHEVFTYNVDGAPRPFLSLYGTAPDLVFFDRLEVLSGPSGVFQGSGEPVGTLNLVRKRPGNRLGAQGALQAGSYDAYRGEADIGGPLNESKTIRARGIAYAQTRESFVDVQEQDKGGGYGTLELDVTEDTTFSFGGIAETQDTVSMSGLPTYTDGGLVDFDRSTYIGADWNTRKIDTAEGFVEGEHTFGYGGVLKIAGRTYSRDVEIKNALGSTGVDRTTGDFDMFTFAREYDELTSYFDANLTSPFSFMGRSSEFTIGADVRQAQQDMKQNFDFSLGTQNIYTFDPSALAEPTVTYPGVGPGFRLNTETESTEIGGYAYSRLQIWDGLNLSFGARAATYDSETEDTGRGTTTEVDADRLVPMVGLSYDVTEQATVYTSYSEIFQPQSEQASDGSQLDPVIGRQVEVGAKGSFLNGRLNAQVAVFWLEDENRAEDDPNNTGFYVASGEAETKGFETYLSGSPYPGIDLTAGYAYVETDLTTDPTPEHSLAAFAKYTFLDGPLQDAYLGAGMQAVSGFSSDSSGTTIDAAGYTVFNAMAGYMITENVDARVFVHNVLDRTYIDRVNTTARGTFYGAPLTATFRISARF